MVGIKGNEGGMNKEGRKEKRSLKKLKGRKIRMKKRGKERD
jgi:hypothetical protein